MPPLIHLQCQRWPKISFNQCQFIKVLQLLLQKSQACSQQALSWRRAGRVQPSDVHSRFPCATAHLRKGCAEVPSPLPALCIPLSRSKKMLFTMRKTVIETRLTQTKSCEGNINSVPLVHLRYCCQTCAVKGQGTASHERTKNIQ